MEQYKGKRRRNILSLRVSDEEFAVIATQANICNKSISDLMREALHSSVGSYHSAHGTNTGERKG